ncbi:MAG: hypothetical protein ACI4PR_04610 [Acutalibacteraceae bacterium]
MDIKDVNLSEENLGKVSGGTGDIPILGGECGIWMLKCPCCGKVMRGGSSVMRIQADDFDSSYFCTECAESLLNSGKAVIEPGYESYYQKYEKSTDSKTGKIIYGWKKI